MYRWTLCLVVLAFVLSPLAAAQGPPDGTPTQSPRPGPDGPGGQRDEPPPGDGGNGSEGRPDDPSRRAGVEIEDARDGFGAQPSDPGSRRPAFSFDLGRSSFTVERPGAPGLQAASDAVLEFIDEDGNGAYDIGEPVLQRHALRDLDAEVRTPATDIRDVHYPLPDNGTVTLRFHLSSGGPDAGAKFDILIEDFPFTDPEGRVAIGFRIDAETGVRPDIVDDAAALVAEGTGDRPYLSWIDHAEIGDEAIPVATSVHVAASGDGGVVYWAYPQAASILHDPVIGYIFVPLDRLGDPIAFISAIGVGGLLLLVGYEARRRFPA